MFNYSEKKYSTAALILILTISLWIILTEIIFPGNKYFPSPSLVILSITDLFKQYRFLSNLLSTISVIYGAIILIFFIVKFKFSFINLEARPLRYFIPFINFFLLIPEILIGLLLIFWLEDKYLAKLIFALFTSAIIVYKTFLKFDKDKISDRIIAARSVGIPNQKINKNIVWKFIEPEIVKNFRSKQTFLWSSMIAFEFIQNFSGVGFTLRNAFRYSDLAIIISILIISIVIIFIFDGILMLINKKYFHWS